MNIWVDIFPPFNQDGLRVLSLDYKYEVTLIPKHNAPIISNATEINTTIKIIIRMVLKDLPFELFHFLFFL